MTKPRAPEVRAEITQYATGLPLNKIAAAMMARAQTSDQAMVEVPDFGASGCT
jgi:hypothetical protein